MSSLEDLKQEKKRIQERYKATKLQLKHEFNHIMRNLQLFRMKEDQVNEQYLRDIHNIVNQISKKKFQNLFAAMDQFKDIKQINMNSFENSNNSNISIINNQAKDADKNDNGNNESETTNKGKDIDMDMDIKAKKIKIFPTLPTVANSNVTTKIEKDTNNNEDSSINNNVSDINNDDSTNIDDNNSSIVLKKEKSVSVNSDAVSETNDKQKRYQCNVKGCKKSYSNKTSLITHKKLHVDPKDSTCLICNKVLSSKRSLKTHMITHGETEFAHKCTFDGCNKAFIHATQLKTHQRVHSGEKPFKCTYKGCGKTFRQTSNLYSHQRRYGH